ncbi:MAG: hypothetical protein A4E45_01215 [Methanosaeta sp. PtaB.Bin039]|nr:MAG: hypothetical protein A4E45_01215 [Methanosaeta sp. PtaB.Bin039]OPY47391.1 MAG: hypothetical protein A4E47_00300 [Methanosaeta sp. PtaU1.Bin028]HOT07120.1 hypothetical protein [Methanotrichaceae archaeon]HQF17064.1 hypothetical protein [Methanotrichaceae archaeon]HQI91685.1 hypothetical protein [Methanotrichaceae archaeon]
MRYELILLAALLGFLALCLLAHQAYLVRVKARLGRSADIHFNMSQLKDSLRLPQGSNFITIMLVSWNLFFVAVVFLYLLTPQVFAQWNYFRLPAVASWELGLLLLGVCVLVLATLINLYLPRIYGYYVISRQTKSLMSRVAPLLLTTSILSSSYLGTIYPGSDELAWRLGYVSLAGALVLLMLPVILSYLGRSK